MKATPTTGLSPDEVETRLRNGLGNNPSQASTRSIRSIVRANTMTRFNALLLIMFVAIAAVGAFKDSIFIWVVVLNSVVGIIQELRARRTLDTLQLTAAPQSRVRRAGVESSVAVEEIVQDDLLVLRRGDEIPVDGITSDAAATSIPAMLSALGSLDAHPNPSAAAIAVAYPPDGCSSRELLRQNPGTWAVCFGSPFLPGWSQRPRRSQPPPMHAPIKPPSHKPEPPPLSYCFALPCGFCLYRYACRAAGGFGCRGASTPPFSAPPCALTILSSGRLQHLRVILKTQSPLGQKLPGQPGAA